MSENNARLGALLDIWLAKTDTNVPLESDLDVADVETDSLDLETAAEGFNNMRPALAFIEITGTLATGLLTAPVKVWGYKADVGRWQNLGTLNEGNDIPITAHVGHSGKVEHAGLYEKLTVTAGADTTVAGTASARFRFVHERR